MDDSILFFSRVSLSKFSLEALFHLWVWGVFILGWEENVKRQVFQNRGGSQLGLVAWLSREFQPCDNRTASCPILSCSALASMIVHLLACLARVLHLAACSRELPARSSRETLFSCTLLSIQHSISLTTLTTNPPKYRLLITEIQANLARNKANKMVDWIQPYILFFWEEIIVLVYK